MTTDHFDTIASFTQAELKVKSSLFIAFAHPVHTEAEVRELLKGYRKKYYDATHVCHAYVLGAARLHTHAADDGEPAHSAGRPILNVLLASGLTQVAVFVVRYFGGAKLGVPGLIDAYGTAASIVIQRANRVERFVEQQVTVQSGFEAENTVFTLLKKEGAQVLKRNTTEQVSVTFAIRQSRSQALCNELRKIPGATVVVQDS